MSGPKTRRVQLTAEQIEEMRRRRERELLRERRIIEFGRKRNDFLQNLQNSPSVSKIMAELRKKAERSGSFTVLTEKDVSERICAIRKDIEILHLKKTADDTEVMRAYDSFRSLEEKHYRILTEISEEKERLDREYHEKLRRLNELKQTISSLSGEIGSILHENETQLHMLQEKISQYDIKSPEAYTGLHKKHEKSSSEFSELLSKAGAAGDNENELRQAVDGLQAVRAAVSTFSLSCAETRDLIVSNYVNRLSDDISTLLQKIREREEEEQEKVRAEAARKAAEAEKKRAEKTAELQKLYDTARRKFAETVSSRNVPEKQAEKLNNLQELWAEATETHAGDPDYLRSFFSISIEPKIKRISADIAEWNSLLNEYNDRLLTYETLCQQLGAVPARFALTESSLVHMDSAIADLREAIDLREQELYIRKSIDEIMQEMGHEVLGYGKSDYSGADHRALYRFADNTAIGVTIDEDNNVCMELGGLDTTDREPDEREAMMLEEDMKNFCSDYRMIKEKLKARGIELLEGHELPPSAEYSQILNLTDYDIDERTMEEIMTSGRHTASQEEKKHLTIDK